MVLLCTCSLDTFSGRDIATDKAAGEVASEVDDNAGTETGGKAEVAVTEAVDEEAPKLGTVATGESARKVAVEVEAGGKTRVECRAAALGVVALCACSLERFAGGDTAAGEIGAGAGCDTGVLAAALRLSQ